MSAWDTHLSRGAAGIREDDELLMGPQSVGKHADRARVVVDLLRAEIYPAPEPKPSRKR